MKIEKPFPIEDDGDNVKAWIDDLSIEEAKMINDSLLDGSPNYVDEVIQNSAPDKSSLEVDKNDNQVSTTD